MAKTNNALLSENAKKLFCLLFLSDVQLCITESDEIVLLRYTVLCVSDDCNVLTYSAYVSLYSAMCRCTVLCVAIQLSMLMYNVICCYTVLCVTVQYCVEIQLSMSMYRAICCYTLLCVVMLCYVVW